MITKLIKLLLGKKEGKKEPGLDIDLMEKKVFVHCESAYRHQRILFRRATENNRITLGEIVSGLFSEVNKTDIQSLAVMYHLEYDNDKRAKETIVNDVSEIWNYDLFSCILKRKTEDGHYTHGLYHETTLVLKCMQRNVILSLTGLGGTDTLKYLRVTILSPCNELSDDGRSFIGSQSANSQSQNIPLSISFILSYSELDNNPELAYFESVERSCDKKLKKNEPLNEVEDEYMHGLYEFSPSYYWGYGQWLFEQERYYDAYFELERFYNFVKSQDIIDDDLQQAYYTTCNIIGKCLLKLERYDDAAYYFRQGASVVTLQMPNYTALANAKLGNPIALAQMAHWNELVAQKYGDFENWPEEMKQFSVDVPVELKKYKMKMDEYMSNTPCYDGTITIGYALNHLLGIKQRNLSPCMFVYDVTSNRFLSRIEETETISNYVLNKKEANSKVFALSCSYAHYRSNEDVDKSILCINAPIIIATHPITVEGSSAIMRVDIVRCNFANDDDKRVEMDMNIPFTKTFCIGEHEVLNYSTEKENLLEAIRKAIEYRNEKRFIESLKLSKWVFGCCQNLLKNNLGIAFESEEELLWDIFYEAAFSAGYSLMELENTTAASYYLDIARHSMQYEHVQEYINFLTNTKDAQALEVIDDVIENSPQPDNQDGINEWNLHMAFLKRRKAYTLIDMQRFHEARELLNKMLNDHLCKEFAEHELEYLDASGL